MSALHLHPDSCNVDFIVEKTLPHAQELVVIVIPEYTWRSDVEELFDLRGHIVVYDKRTKKIHRYSLDETESSQWYSDPFQLSEITIDTAPYIIGTDQRAFGIRLRHHLMSRVNPYSQEILSLFLLDGEDLKPILMDFVTKMYTGETDANCSGEFKEESSILLMSGHTSGQAYANIVVKTSVIHSVNYVGESGECDETSSEMSYSRVLHYNEEVGQYHFQRQ